MKHTLRIFCFALFIALFPNLANAQIDGDQARLAPADLPNSPNAPTIDQSVKSAAINSEPLTVWPNPTLDRVTVSLTDFDGIGILQLIDHTGNVVDERSFEDENKYIYMLSDFGNDTYVIRVIIGTTIRTATVLKY